MGAGVDDVDRVVSGGETVVDVLVGVVVGVSVLIVLVVVVFVVGITVSVLLFSGTITTEGDVMVVSMTTGFSDGTLVLKLEPFVMFGASGTSVMFITLSCMFGVTGTTFVMTGIDVATVAMVVGMTVLTVWFTIKCGSDVVSVPVNFSNQ